MTIIQRLMLIIGILAVVMASMVVWNYIQLNQVVVLADKAESMRVPQLRGMAAVELNVTRVSLQLRHSILARTLQEQQFALDDIAQKRRDIDSALQDYEKKLHTDEGRQRFAPVPGLVQAFWRHGEANLRLIQNGQKEEAFAYLVDQTIPARNALLQVLAGTVEYQTKGLSNDINGIKALIHTNLVLGTVVLVAIVAALVGFAVWMRSTLSQRIGVCRSVAEQVRDGNLMGITLDGQSDEFAPLMTALSEMEQSLTRVVVGVRRSAETVASNSAHLDAGNENLSARTQQQTQSLRQATATVVQLNTTVHQNAEYAHEANTLAGDAAAVATRGGALMQDVVVTMQGISESSHRIAEIINVIDSIAFQTNILALNAAVEAARAGDQGRGFAVVASEVRTLAQRTAAAAKEIKDLIVASTQTVEQGSGLVQNAGATMHNIVEAIARVNGMVREISSASQEQRNGIEHVNQTIQEMEQATQQNVGLVQESAVAARNMRVQADGLVAAVSAFKVNPQARVA